jgi:hypothetical protein
MPTCAIQWITCQGQRTPDTNEAIGDAVSLLFDRQRFPICAEHLTVLVNRTSHMGTCRHYDTKPTTWRFEPYATPEEKGERHCRHCEIVLMQNDDAICAACSAWEAGW